MKHDPKVCFLDALKACKWIIEFTEGLNVEKYCKDPKTKSAVERQFEILGEALNRVKKEDEACLDGIADWYEIIGFRNVIAHGYDVIDDEIIFDAIKNDIPQLLAELKKKIEE